MRVLLLLLVASACLVQTRANLVNSITDKIGDVTDKLTGADEKKKEEEKKESEKNYRGGALEQVAHKMVEAGAEQIAKEAQDKINVPMGDTVIKFMAKKAEEMIHEKINDRADKKDAEKNGQQQQQQQPPQPAQPAQAQPQPQPQPQPQEPPKEENNGVAGLVNKLQKVISRRKRSTPEGSKKSGFRRFLSRLFKSKKDTPDATKPQDYTKPKFEAANKPEVEEPKLTKAKANEFEVKAPQKEEPASEKSDESKDKHSNNETDDLESKLSEEIAHSQPDDHEHERAREWASAESLPERGVSKAADDKENEASNFHHEPHYEREPVEDEEEEESKRAEKHDDDHKLGRHEVDVDDEDDEDDRSTERRAAPKHQEASHDEDEANSSSYRSHQERDLVDEGEEREGVSKRNDDHERHGRKFDVEDDGDSDDEDYLSKRRTALKRSKAVDDKDEASSSDHEFHREREPVEDEEEEHDRVDKHDVDHERHGRKFDVEDDGDSDDEEDHSTKRRAAPNHQSHDEEDESEKLSEREGDDSAGEWQRVESPTRKRSRQDAAEEDGVGFGRRSNRFSVLSDLDD